MSISAVRSRPAKQANEDAYAMHNGRSMRAMAIADGLGSSLDASSAAKLVVDAFVREIKERDTTGRVMSLEEMPSIWRRVAEELCRHRDANPDRYHEASRPLQTTLLSIVDVGETYLISHLGNGSIWLLRGDFWNFLDRRWPWCLTDLAIGHSGLDDTGRDFLYGIVGPSGLTSTPRFISLNKDDRCGEILIATTDGVSSPDQARLGRDDSDKLWIEVNPHIETLVTTHLPAFFRRASENSTISSAASPPAGAGPGGDSLDQTQRSGAQAGDPSGPPSVDGMDVAHDGSRILEKVLEEFLNQGTFDDDATLGVLVSNMAIDNYSSKHPRA